MDTLDWHLGSILPYRIEADVSAHLVHHAVQYGNPIPYGSMPPPAVWYSHPLRRPIGRTIRNTFSYRLDPDLEWEWIDTPITRMVEREVGKLVGLYRRFTRASVIVQIPQMELPLHRDAVAGNLYPGLGRPSIRPEAPDNFLHEAQGHLAFKAPLTALPGDNGCPVVRLGEQEYRYEVGDHFFAINETDMLHGARPSAHPRGVLFVDGVIDMAAYAAIEKAAIPLRALTGRTAVVPGHD